MPPNSNHINQEGAVFKSFFLVENGIFREKGPYIKTNTLKLKLLPSTEVTAKLMEPSKVEGCSGTRNLNDNLADLRAQVAANKKVSKLLLSKITK